MRGYEILPTSLLGIGLTASVKPMSEQQPNCYFCTYFSPIPFDFYALLMYDINKVFLRNFTMYFLETGGILWQMR